MTDKKSNPRTVQRDLISKILSRLAARLRLGGALNAQLASLRQWKWPPLRT